MTLAMFGCQIMYCTLVSDSVWLFSYSEGNFISMIFWVNFALPFIFENFYLNELSSNFNFKLKLFPYLILAFMSESVIESYQFFVLASFRLWIKKYMVGIDHLVPRTMTTH